MLFKFVLLILLVYFLNQAGMNTWEIFWCVLSLCYITLIWYGFSWSEDKLNFDLDYIEEYFTKYLELFLRVLHYIYIAFMLFLFPLVLAVIDNWSNFFYPFEWVLIALSAGISCFLFLGLLLVYLEHRKTWQRYYFTAADKVKLRKREQLFADAIGSTKVLLFAQAIIGLILVYSISIEAYTRGDMHLAPATFELALEMTNTLHTDLDFLFNFFALESHAELHIWSFIEEPPIDDCEALRKDLRSLVNWWKLGGELGHDYDKVAFKWENIKY